MGIGLGSQFTVNVALPLDDRLKVADITARDAIPAGVRYEGMIVYVTASVTNFQLLGGTANSNWKKLSGGGGFKPLASVSASTALTSDDGGALVTTTAGAVTITLPAVAGLDEGAVYVVKKITDDIFTITVTGAAGTETFDGVSGVVTDVISGYLESQLYMLEAGNWIKLVPAPSNGVGKTAVFSSNTTFTHIQSGVKLADASAAALTFTLPDATLAVDKVFTFKKIDVTANTVTIDGNGTQTIDGQATYVLYDQYAVIQIIANGGNWYRLG